MAEGQNKRVRTEGWMGQEEDRKAYLPGREATRKEDASEHCLGCPWSTKRCQNPDSQTPRDRATGRTAVKENPQGAGRERGRCSVQG